MDLSMAVHGAGALQKRLAAKQLHIDRHKDGATRRGAQLLARHVRRALPRQTGTLRKHVHVYRVAPQIFKVKVTGHVAHLVLADTREHAELPEHKRALSMPYGAFARAMHPATKGRPEILPRVRVEHEAEVKLTIREALLHGRI